MRWESNHKKGKVKIMIRTNSSVLAIEEIKIGETYFFGQLWDVEGDGEELLNSGTISPDNENVVAFEIVEENSDICSTVVKVTDIY